MLGLTQFLRHIGKNLVTYSKSSNILALHGKISATLVVPDFVFLFTLPSSSVNNEQSDKTFLVGITSEHTIVLISIDYSQHSSPTAKSNSILSVHSQTRLPLDTPPKLILPVDPMAWVTDYHTGSYNNTQEHDVLLSISEDGELAFWVPGDDMFANGVRPSTTNVVDSKPNWRCTGRVRTGRRGFNRAACSSAKKSVLSEFHHQSIRSTVTDET